MLKLKPKNRKFEAENIEVFADSFRHFFRFTPIFQLEFFKLFYTILYYLWVSNLLFPRFGSIDPPCLHLI